nr:hypothetical protein [Tanacetum cinerariifolium]
MSTTRSGMTTEAIEELITQRVAEALVTQEDKQNRRNIVKSEDAHDDRDEGDNGNGNRGGNRNGIGGGNKNYGCNNRNGNHGVNAGGAKQAAYECTYKEFLNR